MPELALVTVAIVLLAVADLVITIVLVLRTRRFLADAARVPGTIVDIESGTSRDRNTGRRTRMYRPVFSFVGPDGKEHSLTSSASSNSRPTVGDTVTILVPPDNPQKARIDNFLSVWGVPAIMGIVSVPFVIASVILISITMR